MQSFHRLALTLGLAIGLTAATTEAHACACCTNQGQRYVGVAKLDSTLREQISRLRFLAEAELYLGERDTSDIKGITTPSGKYEMHVSQESGRWVFAFNDKAGRKGTLTLAMPATAAIFSVDPRLDEREGGTGPLPLQGMETDIQRLRHRHLYARRGQRPAHHTDHASARQQLHQRRHGHPLDLDGARPEGRVSLLRQVRAVGP